MTGLPPLVRVDTDDDGGIESVSFVTSVPDDAAAVICMRFTFPLLMPGNQIGRCAGCNQAIQFRPVRCNVPRICTDCAPEWYSSRD
jgi:hypothetical protein